MLKHYHLDQHGCQLWWIETGGRLDTVHEAESINWDLWQIVYDLLDYRPVFEKFTEFASTEKVDSWNQVDTNLLKAYAAWLDDQGYAYRTEYLELTTIKQCVNGLVREGLIPQRCRINLSMPKPHGSPTYCYSEAEARAMIQRCAEDGDLIWLGRVICTLVYTGMRVGEAAQLTWDDIDLDDGVIHVRDASRGAAANRGRQDRRAKSSRGRVVPIHASLREMFGTSTYDSEGHAFRGPRGGRLKPDTVCRILKRDVLPAVAKQLYPHDSAPSFLDGRVHSFRHTF
jgi:integrase